MANDEQRAAGRDRPHGHPVNRPAVGRCHVDEDEGDEVDDACGSPFEKVRTDPVDGNAMSPGKGSGAFEPDRREVDPGHAPPALRQPHGVPAGAATEVDGAAGRQPRNLRLERWVDLDQLDGLTRRVPLVPVRPAIPADIHGLRLRSSAAVRQTLHDDRPRTRPCDGGPRGPFRT